MKRPTLKQLARAAVRRQSQHAKVAAATAAAREAVEGHAGLADTNANQAAHDASADNDFIAVLVFESAAQRDAYLDAVGAPGRRFVDGVRLAQLAGIALPVAPSRSTTRPAARWSALT
ncbi:MAG: hypothetical protein SFW67_35455 [Myxococcaceae bacterium]|nr:hypothetical protein [Myxococcaceae bacterium]